MDRKLFNDKLKEANISKKEFAELMGISQTTVNGWGSNRNHIPYWVESWLENYIEMQKRKKDTELMQEIINSLNRQIQDKDEMIKSLDDKNLNGLVPAIQKEFDEKYKVVNQAKDENIDALNNLVSMLQQKIEIIEKTLSIKM